MGAYAKRALPLAMGGLCLWLLWREVSTLDPRAVQAELAYIAPWRWLAAGLATLASFVALAQYDMVAHRHLGTGVPAGPARRAGAAAIAIGQFTGFGPVVGAALRWRLLPALGHGGVVRLTAFVTLSFMIAWTVLALTLALPAAFGLPLLGLPLLPLAAIAALVILLRLPHLEAMGQRLRLPSASAAGQLLLLIFADLVCAGLTLAFLLPPDIAPLWQIVAVYTLALGAGLMGGTPGGIGPFELALVTLLPAVGGEALAASLLAFRLVYYLMPFALGAGYMLIARPAPAAPERPALRPQASGPRAEHQITAQAQARLLSAGEASAPVLMTPNSAMLFLAPQTGALPDLLRPLRQLGRAENRIPCLYKLSARDAVAARRAGWRVAPFATEAWVNPQDFALDTPSHRQLRRLLRKAEKSGITVSRPQAPDWPALEEINEAWSLLHGGERGLTMGRFCPGFLSDKPLFVAAHHGKPIAFISFVSAPGVLSLDLMRHVADVPPGTMQLLMTKAIEAARREGCHELNLAALPHPSLARLMPGTEGLQRFKTAFGPNWRTLYIGATDPLSLVISATDIWFSIRHPDPLPPFSGDWAAHPATPQPQAIDPAPPPMAPLDPARIGGWINELPADAGKAAARRRA